MKILFQGDSITEWNRDKSNPEDLGSGYVRVASEAIARNLRLSTAESAVTVRGSSSSVGRRIPLMCSPTS